MAGYAILALAVIICLLGGKISGKGKDEDSKGSKAVLYTVGILMIAAIGLLYWARHKASTAGGYNSQ